MERGFLAGIFWGGVVGVGMLAVSSQTLERQQLSFPKPEAGQVEVPGGSEFDQARPESEPVLPGTEPAPAGEVITGVTPPEDAVETPPAFDTSSLDVPQPSLESPSGLGEVPAVVDDASVPEISETPRVGSESNLAAGPGTPTLEAPEAPVTSPGAETTSPDVAEAPASEGADIAGAEAGSAAPQPAPEVAALPRDAGEAAPAPSEAAPAVVSEDSAPVSPVSPDISEAPSLPGVRVPDAEAPPAEEDMADQPEPAQPEAPIVAEPAPAAPEEVVVDNPGPVPTPDVSDAPDSGGVVTVDGGDTQFFTPVDSLGDRAESVEVNRLPTVGDDSGGLPVVRRLPGTPVTEETEGEDVAALIVREETEEEAPEPGGPAIRAHAMDYDGADVGAVVSVVLLHDGASAMPASTIDRLPPTVAFAVEASAPNAAEIASAYRRAGREVVMIPSLPPNAAPQDVEVALSDNLSRIPEAVAIMDLSGDSFQSDRSAVSQVVAVIGDTGHGLITFPRGLNTAHQQAERAGLPAGLIFRVLDEDGETDDQIRRTLDRAAFRARQSDAVILVGHTRDGTIDTLAAWANDMDETISLAPVSVALTAE